MTVHDTLAWKPKAKERPRFRVAGKKVITYTPRATIDAEKALAAQWTQPPIEGPIEVAIRLTNDAVEVVIAECEDYSNRKLRADIDNYAKLILDALNGVAFTDDSQIVYLEVRKE